MRLFCVSNEGEVNWYKDGDNLRGTFWLTKDSTCEKTSKIGVEIRTPDRPYYIEEVKKGDIDVFMNVVNDVIKTLR